MTAEVILSELGDISRFRNAKAVCAYAGLVPIVRQSGEKKSKHMRITKEGSGLLRWALVEAVWRLVRESPKWAARFSRLMQRSGKKRAIVAMARKLLCVLYAMLRTSTPYQIVSTETKAPRAPGKKVVRISRKEQTATLQTATVEQTATLQTATAEQTAATRRARKQSTTATTAKPTTTKQTTAARTTRKKLLTRPTPEPTTTT